MKIPFTGLEIRQAGQGFTDAIVEALANAAAGEDRAKGKVPSAASIAASMWARAFATATVTPVNSQTSALTPMILADMARSLCLHGESVYEIAVGDGAMVLDRSCDWTITGDSAWSYELQFARPSATVKRTVESARVIHVRHGSTAAEPWKGRGLLQNEKTAVKVATLLELSLGDEMSLATGAVAPMPAGDNAKLQADLNRLTGDLRIVESTGGNWDLGNAGSSRPIQDFAIKRLGPNPPESLEGLYESLSRQILAAAGVSSALLGNSNGTYARESFRQFLHSTIQPVAAIAAVELSDKLDVPDLSFDFSDLMASDISGRARSFASMVKGGMSLDRAAALAGLLVQDDD